MTKTPREFMFSSQLVMSDGVSEASDVQSILLDAIPGAIDVVRANEIDDRSGTDWWVVMSNGVRLSVDAKVRDQDWLAKPPPFKADDLALETWSVVESQKIGWTRDDNKKTDYVLWLWKDTGRWCLVPFRMLCGVFTDHWQSWSTEFKTATQKTVGRSCWHSECVFVPRRTVWEAIYNKYSGRPGKV